MGKVFKWGFVLLFLSAVFYKIFLSKTPEEYAAAAAKEKADAFERLTQHEKDSILDYEKRLQEVAEENRRLREEEEKKEEALFLKSKAGKIWKKHPDWTRDECKDVAAGKVWIGMSYEMLKYQRGLPNHANPSNYGNGDQWQWCWNDWTPSCFYDTNGDGIIDSYN